LVELPELFAGSDFLAVNCPLIKATAKIVNADRLATMKPTAYA
jgi:lactate dehydrogenase-like 2-hydroxyacid dehydrogenase